jgi:hypothetical protein
MNSKNVEGRGRGFIADTTFTFVSRKKKNSTSAGIFWPRSEGGAFTKYVRATTDAANLLDCKNVYFIT